MFTFASGCALRSRGSTRGISNMGKSKDENQATTAGAPYIRARDLMQRHRICTANRFLNVSIVLGLMSMMSLYNYERQAQAAMSMALAATGHDRQKWVRVAVAWYHLGRNAADHERVLSSGQQALSPAESVTDSPARAAKIRVT